MFLIIVLAVCIATACLPLLANLSNSLGYTRFHSASPLLPALAGFLFLFSFYLPDVGISSETTTFQQHFVGGGVYSALLYIYLQQIIPERLRIKPWPIDSFYLFAWVSALGVINKLLEFGLLEAGLMKLDTSDAYWDLLANTLGAFVAYYLYKLVSLAVSNFKIR
ncbi:MAG TPA: hypothetical protein VJ841_04780 [Candidatus Saccharimonadales bacterium]|nr:hypothetical protein [Candidatus Saccharimonadales bacterium]